MRKMKSTTTNNPVLISNPNSYKLYCPTCGSFMFSTGKYNKLPKTHRFLRCKCGVKVGGWRE